MRRAWLAVVIVVAGCPGFKKHNNRNAPGVVDIDTPPVTPERGDPAMYEVPADPGEHHLGVAPAIFIGPGLGRLGDLGATDSTLEVGGQVHLSFGESATSGGKNAFDYPWSAWGLSLGWGLQTNGSRPTIAAPVYVEATRHFYLASASAGLAVYPTAGNVYQDIGGVDLGAQLTIAFWPYMVRFRYMQDTGFEVFGVVQFEVPASVTWSK